MFLYFPSKFQILNTIESECSFLPVGYQTHHQIFHASGFAAAQGKGIKACQFN